MYYIIDNRWILSRSGFVVDATFFWLSILVSPSFYFEELPYNQALVLFSSHKQSCWPCLVVWTEAFFSLAID